MELGVSYYIEDLQRVRVWNLGNEVGKIEVYACIIAPVCEKLPRS